MRAKDQLPRWPKSDFASGGAPAYATPNRLSRASILFCSAVPPEKDYVIADDVETLCHSSVLVDGCSPGARHGTAAGRKCQSAADRRKWRAPQAQAAEQLETARKNLARLPDLSTQAKDDDNRLAELKVEVDAAAKQIIATSVATRPRLDEIKARLTELGDPPTEGAPPEADVVAQERKRLLAERGEINALTGTAEDLSIQATKLSNGITATRRALFSNTLLKHTDINRTMVMDAIAAISVERETFMRTSAAG